MKSYLWIYLNNQPFVMILIVCRVIFGPIVKIDVEEKRTKNDSYDYLITLWRARASKIQVHFVIPQNDTSPSEWKHSMCHHKKGQYGLNRLMAIGFFVLNHTMLPPMITPFCYDFLAHTWIYHLQPICYMRVVHSQHTYLP